MVHSTAAALLIASLLDVEISGTVRFSGLPLPGATVSAVNGSLRHVTISGADGIFRFTSLPDSSLWTVKVDMQLFAPLTREVTAPSLDTTWDLELLPISQLGPVTAAPKEFARTEATISKTSKPAPQQTTTQTPSDLADRAADGLMVAGSVNNGAASPFAQLPAFGNNRRGQRGLYNGNLGVILNNSTFDARAFSLTGQLTPKPDYNRLQALVSFGGPLWIPGLTRRTGGPNFSVNYQWTRNSNASTATGLMPTAAERVTNNPQARALLDLYPLPNFTGSNRYNYQIPLVSGQHQDDLQSRITKQIKRNYLSGNFNWQNTRTDTPDLFGFLNLGRVNGINTGATYRRTFNPRTFVNTGITYSSLSTQTLPYFANRRNVSAEAGITGNNQDPINWGPPSLQFANGISGIALPQAADLRNQTVGFSADAFMSRGRHNLSYGYTHRRQQFNVVSQQDARGTLAFAGSFDDFLNGVPTTSSIAFGNADKYLRATTDETFLNDDFRVNPGLTLNLGLRWEYWSPAKEKYGRLVNLNNNGTPVIGATLQPDRNNFAPRVAFSWRPIPASSMVIRGGYGVYYDTSIYQPIAMQMAQQAPLSNSIRIANTPQTPLTLANPFPRTNVSTGNATTFAVDPNFRTGYLHTWQMSLQRDLPAGLQLTATYLGSKGTRGQQQILPNTFPQGAIEPAGYNYLMSNGNSTRNSGQLQLRRRLRSGFTANLSYTWAKAIDNATNGGNRALVAQNWLDLRAERARSNFDQRHLLTGMLQYTPGMGIKGGALATGWKAKLLRDWTFAGQYNLGSGLPLTPVYFAPVAGTGVTGSVRPDYTGAPQFIDGRLNPAAYAMPAPGKWGNAGRNTITGPKQLAVNASLGRTFRSAERVNFDFRIDASNVLNNVTYPSWNTVLGSAQFGLPLVANPMRIVQTAIRVRF
ncbi:hypothetical protein F183_A42130 [Bryobacterales bacterium F-183]|nr:hypothetical protein F183_A42130 [Bryobacterales bacterium F-183]